MTKSHEYKAGGRVAGMADHAVAGPIMASKKTVRTRRRSVAHRYATFSQPSISAGTFKARKLIVRGLGTHNPMVARVHGLGLDGRGIKQPGRRYGPPPASTSSGQGQGRSKRKIESKEATS